MIAAYAGQHRYRCLWELRYPGTWNPVRLCAAVALSYPRNLSPRPGPPSEICSERTSDAAQDRYSLSHVITQAVRLVPTNATIQVVTFDTRMTPYFYTISG